MSDERGFPAFNGIRNFDQVTDQLWRGAQPNHVGINFLRSLEITDIVNLRRADDVWPAEARVVLDSGMNYANLQMSGLASPDPAEFEVIMDYLKNSMVNQGRKLFVHCEHGCDRTGTVIACARIRFEQWGSDLALKEADFYGMSGFEIGMRKFIENFK